MITLYIFYPPFRALTITAGLATFIVARNAIQDERRQRMRLKKRIEEQVRREGTSRITGFGGNFESDRIFFFPENSPLGLARNMKIQQKIA